MGIWCHWLLYDLAPQVHNLAQGYKPGALGVSGRNDFGKRGYGGPCPPKGKPHRYFFKLYALSEPSLGLAPGVSRKELVSGIKGHVLGETQYLGWFQQN